jgi:hypothetical protein
MSSEKVDQERAADSFEEQRQIDLVNNANARSVFVDVFSRDRVAHVP